MALPCDFDLVIIGAGINGASVAREASLQGYRILVLEQYEKPARGTSSRSSKLIHGGLRYLESFEFGLVYECLSDRDRLLKLYPDLVKLQNFHIPVFTTSSRSRLVINAGLVLYSLLGGLRQHNRFRKLKKNEWQELDNLDTRNLLGVYQYFDAVTDDALLTDRLVAEAEAAGASILNNSEFLHCTVTGGNISIAYRQNAKLIEVKSRYLINAAGPWVNHVADLCKPAFKKPDIDLVQGAHIEIPGVLTRGIYYLEAPQDRRAVFAIPWHGHILLGTTETLYTGNPADPQPTPAEIDYLLTVYNHYFTCKLNRTDVITSWAGLRVLPGNAQQFFRRTRETVLHPNDRENPRIYSIYGGKLTSHYSTASKLLKLLNHKTRL